jgi:hypothetical protein
MLSSLSPPPPPLFHLSDLCVKIIIIIIMIIGWRSIKEGWGGMCVCPGGGHIYTCVGDREIIFKTERIFKDKRERENGHTTMCVFRKSVWCSVHLFLLFLFLSSFSSFSFFLTNPIVLTTVGCLERRRKQCKEAVGWWCHWQDGKCSCVFYFWTCHYISVSWKLYMYLLQFLKLIFKWTHICVVPFPSHGYTTTSSSSSFFFCFLTGLIFLIWLVPIHCNNKH